MENEELVLAAVDLIDTPPEARMGAWRLVCAAAAVDGADGFAVETNRRQEHSDELRPLNPAQDIGDQLGRLAEESVSVNLYRGDEWLAGAADWGSGLSMLFEKEQLLRLLESLKYIAPKARVDTAEVYDRPRLIPPGEA